MKLDATVDVQNLIGRDNLAVELSNRYQDWHQSRTQWEREKVELREYVFATDTTKTSNSSLPWKNTTVRPKLCQIRDNLHANYMAALFPNDDWLEWEAGSEDDAVKEKADAIKHYMRNKTSQNEFKHTVSQLVYDYIDYGNAFGDVVFENSQVLGKDDEVIDGYIGPRLVRISPLDIVIDPTASHFSKTPKMTRSLLSLGEIKKQAKKYPEMAYQEEILDKIFDVRHQMAKFDSTDISKGAGFVVDGFGNTSDYYRSGYVELITFEGDIYDINTGDLQENRKVTIVDRSYVLANEPIDTWTGESTKKHVAWRLRPDNIYGMGPLDNLVGMQYRIDHLENIKADVFDLIAYPPLVIKGYVEDFEWAPLAEIVMDTDADVTMLRPDTTALNADIQIANLENEMEEMAGAPKQAMGIRTPGEKTAYEVQQLENAAGRIFQSKVQYFEEQFLEPLLNSMLIVGRQNITTSEIVRVIDSTFGAEDFLEITKEDLTAKGKLKPKGARHFAARAQFVQEVTQLMQTIGQDPSVAVHISGKKLAKLFEDKLGLKEYDLVQDNIRVLEQLETQQVLEAGQEELAAQNVTEEAPEEEGLVPEGLGDQGQQQL